MSTKAHIIYSSIILILAVILSIFVVTSYRTGIDYRARIKAVEDRAVEYERIVTESDKALADARSANTDSEQRIKELESELEDSKRENIAIRGILEKAVSDVQSGNGRVDRIIEATGKIREIIKDMENSQPSPNSDNSR